MKKLNEPWCPGCPGASGVGSRPPSTMSHWAASVAHGSLEVLSDAGSWRFTSEILTAMVPKSMTLVVSRIGLKLWTSRPLLGSKVYLTRKWLLTPDSLGITPTCTTPVGRSLLHICAVPLCRRPYLVRWKVSAESQRDTRSAFQPACVLGPSLLKATWEILRNPAKAKPKPGVRHLSETFKQWAEMHYRVAYVPKCPWVNSWQNTLESNTTDLSPRDVVIKTVESCSNSFFLVSKSRKKTQPLIPVAQELRSTSYLRSRWGDSVCQALPLRMSASRSSPHFPFNFMLQCLAAEYHCLPWVTSVAHASRSWS